VTRTPYGHSTTLADSIASYVAGTGRPLTAEGIARALCCRTIEVRRVLQEDPRFVPWPSKRKKLYGVTVGGSDSSDAGDGQGRAV
jgi:hypothetical protein